MAAIEFRLIFPMLSSRPFQTPRFKRKLGRPSARLIPLLTVQNVLTTHNRLPSGRIRHWKQNSPLDLGLEERLFGGLPSACARELSEGPSSRFTRWHSTHSQPVEPGPLPCGIVLGLRRKHPGKCSNNCFGGVQVSYSLGI